MKCFILLSELGDKRAIKYVASAAVDFNKSAG
jgi:hypothetical protein